MHVTLMRSNVWRKVFGHDAVEPCRQKRSEGEKRVIREKLELDMNLFYCSYPYGTASTSIFTGAFAWDKQ